MNGWTVRQPPGAVLRLAAGAAAVAGCLAPWNASAQAPGVSGPLTLEGAPGLVQTEGTPRVASAGGPRLTIQRADTAPTIDGRLDDAVWSTSARITEFVQQRPLEGAPATEQTEVYIAYDNQQIYFGIYAHYSDLGLRRANRAARDQIGRDDSVDIFFDPFLDAQRAYIFSVNGYGVQGDRLMSTTDTAGGGGGGTGGGGGGGGGGNRGGGGGGGGGGGSGGGGNFGDVSWDALFASAGRLVEDGWTAEMAIPFKSLRYPARANNEGHRWGFQIERNVESKNESMVWAPISRAIPGFLTQMGVLEGMTNLSTSRNLELLPTFTAIQASRLDTVTGEQVTDNNPSGGVNLKYGFTPTLVSDFTYNPDFSQIESDRQQIEVNQRFPIFYPELRPFFLEGQEIYQVPGPVTYVHTRTIVDPLYGVKLSGKVGKTAIGILASSDQAPGRIEDPTDPLHGVSAQAFIGRARYDFYQESSIGGIFTNRNLLDGYSRLAGIDGAFRFRQIYRVAFGAMFSDRQDQQNLHRTGPSLNANFTAQGRNLSYGLSYNQIDPDFGTELGFVRRVDQKETIANVQYRWYPEHWITNWGPRLEYNRNFNYEGIMQDEILTTGVNFQFARNMMINANLDRSMERYLGVDFHKTRYSFFGNVNAIRLISFGGGYNDGDQIRYIETPYLGEGAGLNFFANIRPFSRLQMQLNLNRSQFTDVRTNIEVFDIKIVRAQTSFQVTDRLTLRNIMEHNTYDRTLGANFLVTYRVNSGTVFYVGFDSRYRQGDRIDDVLFPTTGYQRTNRAIFTKLQYLLRY